MNKPDSVEGFQVGKCHVTIEYDQDAESPREWGNLGKMVCWHHRYNLGDEQPKYDADEYLLDLARDQVSLNYPDSFLEHNRDKILTQHFTILPLYLYDHSGITMSTGAFSCPWDSGQVGFIYASLKDVLKEKSLTAGSWNTKVSWQSNKQAPETITIRQYAERVLKQEVETYDEFLTGQVYGYVVEDENGEHLDSCWGFFGLDYCKEQAREVAEYRNKQITETEAQTAIAETMP